MIRPNRPCMARQAILADFKQRDSPKISAEMRFLFIFTTILTYLTLPRPSKLVYFLLCLPILRGRHFEIMDLPFCKSLEKRNDHGCIHSPVMERQVLNRNCGEKTILILTTTVFSLQDTALHQHCDCVYAKILHVSFFHAISSQLYRVCGPLPGSQSGRTASKVGTRYQNRSHVLASRPAPTRRSLRGLPRTSAGISDQ